jgi:hypothetical protein
MYPSLLCSIVPIVVKKMKSGNKRSDGIMKNNYDYRCSLIGYTRSYLKRKITGFES